MLGRREDRNKRISYHHVEHDTSAPILEVRNVDVHFQGIPALEDISFSLSGGERLAVVGPNGAGKSTLFNVIAGIQPPTRGEVHIFGHRPAGHICIAYVPQRASIDLSYPVTLFDVVMMGRAGKLGLFRRPKAVDREFVKECIETVGLADKMKKHLRELSGGQQQRALIARALAQEAELVIMDEPFTGIDLPGQEDLFTALDQLQALHFTVLVSLHDLSLAIERFELAMLLNKRMIGIGKPKDVFNADNLGEAFSGQVRLVETPDGMMIFADSCCRRGESE